MAIEKRGQEPLYLALDLGSNSFHLLLACFRQGKMVRLDRRKEVVRLASGLNEDGSLSAEVRELALTTLSAFAPFETPSGIQITDVRNTTLGIGAHVDRGLTEPECLFAPLDDLTK